MFHANLAGKIFGRLAGAENIVASLRVAEKERWHHLFIERWTSWLNTKILCNSNGLAKFAESHGLPCDKLTIIPNSFDASLFTYSKRSHPRDSRWRLLFLGRVAPQKGLPYLFDALKGLADSGVDFQLDMVGDSPNASEREALERQAIDNGISDQVSFIPPIPHDKIPELMNKSHFLVLPSLWEGMPNVIMESFASGLPVVGTDIEGTNELVIDGETGSLAIPADTASLAEKIRWICENYDESVSMAETASNLIRKNYAPDLIHNRYLRFYRKLAKEPTNNRNGEDPASLT
jgi:glycosyltransferase involved in cell wall biosynthesis